MAITRLGLHGSAAAYAGFAAKDEAVSDVSNINIDGTYSPAQSIAGQYDLGLTVAGVYAPGISITGEWETE